MVAGIVASDYEAKRHVAKSFGQALCIFQGYLLLAPCSQ